MTDALVELLAANWWALAIRGLAAILFGVLAFLLPGITVASLVLLFGVYAIVEGVFNLVAAWRGSGDGQPWWALTLEGLVSIGAGIVTFLMPGVTALVLLYVIAAWAIVTGVFEIAAAIRLRQRIANEWWLVLSGIFSVGFGVVLMVAPAAGALAVVFWIGAYALVFGVLLTALALRLRTWRKEMEARERLAA